jgi:small conductance mechanosensitive channel
MQLPAVGPPVAVMVGDQELGDWLLDRPLRIGLTLVVAVIVTVVYRRLVHRFASRVAGNRAQTALDQMSRHTAGAIRPMESSRSEARMATIERVLLAAGTAAIWLTTFLIVLSELDVNLAPLLAGAGVAGVALGFGAQQMVRDYLAGFFIVIEDQYGIGDVVDLGEAVGTVEEVGLRATRLRDVDGVVWHVPNGELTRVGNMSKQWARALVDVSVAYDTDVREAMQLILATAEAMAADEVWSDVILETPEMWGVQELAPDGVTLRLIVKTRPGEQFAVSRELKMRLKEALDRAGIEIPFPQRTMWLRDPDSTEGA